MLRILPMNPEDRQAVEALARFAALPENHYLPGQASWVPGQRPEFVRQVGSYRLVFTWTRAAGRLFRHLTVSVPTPGAFPQPVVAFTLASWCGFTGGKEEGDVVVEPGEDWSARPSVAENCVVLIQEVQQ